MDDIGSTCITTDDTKGNIRTAVTTLPYLTYENEMFQYSNVRHDKGNILDLSSAPLKSIIINESTDCLFNGNNDRHTSPLEIMIPKDMQDALMHSYIYIII